MPVCVFKTDEVIRCVEHALNATEWGMGWLEDETPQPALFFVHDQGVYVMSNGMPTDRDEGADRAYVAYAEGCNPNSGAPFEEWYNNARELVGGDDFVETLTINNEWLERCRDFEEMHFNITGSQIAITFANRRHASANA